MLKKIHKEIEDFTNNIKKVKECDELLKYMNSSIFSSIKLLMSISKTFSLYSKMMIFLIIALIGLLFMSSVGTDILNSGLLSITFVLFSLMLVYVMYYKKSLTLSILKSRNLIEEADNN